MTLASPPSATPNTLTIDAGADYRKSSGDLSLRIASRPMPTYKTKASGWSIPSLIIIGFVAMLLTVFLVSGNVEALAVAVAMAVTGFRFLLDPRGGSRSMRESTVMRPVQTIEIAAGVLHAGKFRLPVGQVRLVHKLDATGDHGVWAEATDGDSYCVASQLRSEEAEFIVQLLTR